MLDDTGLLNENVQEWMNRYNEQQPHRVFGGKTPYEALKRKVHAKISTDLRRPNTSDTAFELP